MAIFVDFWWIFRRFWCRNGCRNGFVATHGAGRFSMAFSLKVSINVARFLAELLFRQHRWDTGFYRVKRYVAMFAHRRFDQTFFARRDRMTTLCLARFRWKIRRKSAENRLRIRISAEIGWRSALGSVLAAIFTISGHLGAVLGDFLAPRSPPSLPRGALARPRALQEAPRDPPRATKVDLRRRKSDPERPKSTQGGPKARFLSDFG